jgi:hypothetical protein
MREGFYLKKESAEVSMNHFSNFNIEILSRLSNLLLANYISGLHRKPPAWRHAFAI